MNSPQVPGHLHRLALPLWVSMEPSWEARAHNQSPVPRFKPTEPLSFFTTTWGHRRKEKASQMGELKAERRARSRQGGGL